MRCSYRTERPSLRETSSHQSCVTKLPKYWWTNSWTITWTSPNSCSVLSNSSSCNSNASLNTNLLVTINKVFKYVFECKLFALRFYILLLQCFLLAYTIAYYVYKKKRAILRQEDEAPVFHGVEPKLHWRSDEIYLWERERSFQMGFQIVEYFGH